MSNRTGIPPQRDSDWADGIEAFMPLATDYGRWWGDREQDGVASLHDVESEAGEEAEIFDLYLLDHRAARHLGVHLDRTGAREPLLD